jgi:hypothetical protein
MTEKEDGNNGLYLHINGVVADLQMIRFVNEVCKLLRYDENLPTYPGELKKIYAIKIIRSMPNTNYGLKECKDLVEWIERHTVAINNIPYDLTF